jgi:hypothetical protein
MTKCQLCGKDKTEYEMRPLINVAELKMGEAMTEEKSEREIGGAKLQIVCRGCWQHILENKEKGEIIEMMETLCGLLFEIDRKQHERNAALMGEIIEKAASPIRKITMITRPAINLQPMVPQYEEDDSSNAPIVAPLMPQPLAPSWPNTALPSPWFQPKHWVVGQHQITYGDIQKLGEDWNITMCSSNTK